MASHWGTLARWRTDDSRWQLWHWKRTIPRRVTKRGVHPTPPRPVRSNRQRFDWELVSSSPRNVPEHGLLLLPLLDLPSGKISWCWWSCAGP